MKQTEKIRTIVFDWDGTLHKTEKLYADAVYAELSVLKAKGFRRSRELTDAKIRSYLGMSAPDMWNRFMPELPDEMKREGAARIGAAMNEGVRKGRAVLYDGAAEVLGRLKNEGYTLVFLSNCPHSYMEESRAYFGLDRYFSAYFAAEDYGYRPKTELFGMLSERPEQFPAGILMVGDRASDIRCALDRGGLSIGCGYGYGTKEELSGAARIISDIRELPECVRELSVGCDHQ